jgi:hypothetical protein
LAWRTLTVNNSAAGSRWTFRRSRSRCAAGRRGPFASPDPRLADSQVLIRPRHSAAGLRRPSKCPGHAWLLGLPMVLADSNAKLGVAREPPRRRAAGLGWMRPGLILSQRGADGVAVVPPMRSTPGCAPSRRSAAWSMMGQRSRRPRAGAGGACWLIRGITCTVGGAGVLSTSAG